MKYFPVNLPQITDSDKSAVLENLDSTWISGESPAVKSFEDAFSKSHKNFNAISVSNGSVALELAFASLDLKPGDEVILPSLTIISCLAPILRQGLVPIFVDANLTDWNLDTEKLLDKITNKTKAILVVHTYGLCVDLRKISEVCREKEIFLIEDCAEVQGAINDGQPAGTHGDIATFSFYSNKVMTTGEGGMCITPDSNIAHRLRSLRNLAFKSEMRFKHDELGFNFRLTGMQAALGESQLARVPKNVTHKQELALRYQENLADYSIIQWQPRANEVGTNVYWVAALQLNEVPGDAAEVITNLDKVGVGARPFFYPLHMQPLLAKYSWAQNQVAPNSEKLWKYGLYLPSGNGYSRDDIDEICERIIPVLKRMQNARV